MASNDQLTVNVPPSLRKAIEEAVTSGRYRSTDDVLSEALVAWELDSRAPVYSDEDLRVLWDQGIASGPSKFFSMEEIIAEARKRYANSKKSVA